MSENNYKRIVINGVLAQGCVVFLLFLVSCIDWSSTEPQEIPIIELVTTSPKPDFLENTESSPPEIEQPESLETESVASEAIDDEISVAESEPIISPKKELKKELKKEPKKNKVLPKVVKKTPLKVKNKLPDLLPKSTISDTLPALPDPMMAMPKKRLPLSAPIGKPSDPRLNTYRNLVNAEIQRRWKPQKGRPVAHGSKIILEVTIMKDGSKTGMKMVKSSGDTYLDHFAKRALNLARFGPFPPNYPNNSWKVTIGLIYENN
jgi:TonB family protein